MSWCAVSLRIESGSKSVSQSWRVIGFRVLWESKLVTGLSRRRRRCWSIAALVAIVSKTQTRFRFTKLESHYVLTERVCGHS